MFLFLTKRGVKSKIFRLRKLFKKREYDIVFNFHRFGSSGILTTLSGAKKKYGFKKNPFSFAFTKRFDHKIGDGTHEVSRNLEMLKEFGANPIAKPELYPPKQSWDKTLQYKTANYYCIAPASVSFNQTISRTQMDWIDQPSRQRKQYLPHWRIKWQGVMW